MRNRILILSFLMFLGAAVQAQTSLPKQYLEAMGNLVKKAAPAEQSAERIVTFAKNLIGVPYRYASSSPSRGFDCSGFVNYVFKSVGIDVPRSSSEFMHAGTPIKLSDAKVGDVLIFTGSNPRLRRVGHVGIVYSVEGDRITFIHSSSGKADGVTITPLEGYYKSRFIKAVSII